MPIALMYHDVVSDGRCDSSGFPGASAARYKLARETFAAHLEALHRTAVRARTDDASRCVLTFDDGGVSAYTDIAGMLESHGWRGYFFITTDLIGKRGFVSADQIRALRDRGHFIGSHSCSHPTRMSACSSSRLLDEWHASTRILADILNQAVTLASVPGGYYSPAVGRAAATAGIKVLFTSEPTVRTTMLDECRIIGRFAIYRETSARTVAALSQQKPLARWRQSSLWTAKKIAKTLGGETYLRVRDSVLSSRHRRSGAHAVESAEMNAIVS